MKHLELGHSVNQFPILSQIKCSSDRSKRPVDRRRGYLPQLIRRETCQHLSVDPVEHGGSKRLETQGSIKRILIEQILANSMKALDSLREQAKSSSDLTLKANISTLYDSLLDLKAAVLRVEDENTELRQALRQQTDSSPKQNQASGQDKLLLRRRRRAVLSGLL